MKVLMVRPDYFKVTNLLMNPYMTGEKKINRKKAIHQWEKLVNLLERLGVMVIKMTGIKNIVDMVFAANAGSIVANHFFPSNFYYSERQIESSYYQRYLKKRGYQIVPVKGYFEGQGDTQYSHNKTSLWVGHGQRTSLEGAKSFIRQAAKVKSDNNYYLLHLIDPYFYHLDTCLRCFGEKYAIYYPDAFSEQSQDLLIKVFGQTNLISLKRSDALNFVANAFEIKEHRLLIAHYLPVKIKKQLKRLGFSTIETDMSEFLLSGGSVKCCLLDLVN